MRGLIVVNDVSGDRVSNSEKVRQVHGSFTEAGLDLDVVLLQKTDDVGDIARRAVESGAEIIVVAGGDGTVGQVAAVLVQTNATLGILPLGTFNNIARSVAIPAEVERAVEVIIQGKTQKIDVGRVQGGPYFFEVAGAGLDAELFPLGEEIKGGGWTRLSVFAHRLIRFRAPRITLTFDRSVAEALQDGGRSRYSDRTLSGNSIRLRCLLVAIANGPYYGGGFTVAPGARLTDGHLTVAVYRNFSKIELMRHFMSIMGGQTQYSPKVETFTVKSIRVESKPPLPIHADGVAFGESPQTLESLPGALKVLVP